MSFNDEKYRIKRSESQESRMRYLSKHRIMDSYADILALSAMIGYNNKVKIPIQKSAKDAVQMSFFDKKDLDLMNFIAYAETKSQKVLVPDSMEKYEIFESYANGGFEILWDELELDEHEDNIDQYEVATKLYNLVFFGFKSSHSIEDSLFI